MQIDLGIFRMSAIKTWPITQSSLYNAEIVNEFEAPHFAGHPLDFN